MFRLTREVRFCVNPEEDCQLTAAPTNSFAGYPSLLGLGHYLSLEVTLVGDPSPQDGCVQNIKLIDQAVREAVVPMVTAYVRRGRHAGGALLLCAIYERLKDAWLPAQLHHLRLALSPFLTLSFFATESPMVRLSQKF